MGCDIHLFVEVRNNPGRPWRSADRWYESESGAMRTYVYRDGEFVGTPFYDGRNYDLFGMLAGVRSGSDIVPIHPPRGIPTECSPEVLAAIQAREDGHSHSWATVAELLAYDWTGTDSEGRPYHQLARDFLAYTMPRLWRLGDPNNVRIVYFFDN